MVLPFRSVALIVLLLASATQAQLRATEVDLEVRSFGAGGFARPGGWIGLHLNLTDNGEGQREVIVRAGLPDEDGDTAEYERVLATNQGVTQGVWLYVRLPTRFGASDLINIEVFEAIESSSSTGRAAFRAGRLLGELRAPPRGFADAGEAMIGVVGGEAAGLQRYAVQLNGQPWSPLGHERSQVVTGLSPSQLPDRWTGLAQFDVMVWTRGAPSDLRQASAEAIREWVQRGGHLVVVVPGVGQEWTNPNSNPLYDVLPAVAFHRDEGVDLEPYRDLLARADTSFPMPKDASLHTFVPIEDALPSDAVRLLVGRDGRCVVARRQIGIGAVTLVGLDLTNASMRLNALPVADVFWHRVLGRRGRLPTTAEALELSSAALPIREHVTLDSVIPAEIAKTGRAAAGVLLGFVVFGLYWIVAGPVGYAILRKTGRRQHAWVAYLATAAVFTAIAWGGATLIKPGSVSAEHLTVLDHVYGQNIERGRAWMSVLVPAYGDSTISIAAPDGAGSRTATMHDLIAPWEPGDALAGRSVFPDARGYHVESTRPDMITIPTRSTVKQLQIDWAGPPAWRMPRPVAGEDGEARIGIYREGAWRATGRLRHELPGPLEGALVLIVGGQTDLTGQSSAQMLAHVRAKVVTRWAPGEDLDLAELTSGDVQRNEAAYFSELVGRFRSASVVQGASRRSATNAQDPITAISFLNQLEPPPEQSNTGRTYARMKRTSTHGFDLGRWFTQPCIIIVGHMGRAGAGRDDPGRESPIPLQVDGRSVPTFGRTVVRWVYPLPDAPPAYARTSNPE